MAQSRTLHLKKETLAELDASELAGILGGAQEIPTLRECPLTGLWPTLPVLVCLAPQTT